MIRLTPLHKQRIVQVDQLCHKCLSNAAEIVELRLPDRVIHSNDEKVAEDLVILHYKDEPEELQRLTLNVSLYPTYFDGYNILEHMFRLDRVDNVNEIGLFVGIPIAKGQLICTFGGYAMPHNEWLKKYGSSPLHRRYTYVKEEFGQVIAMDATHPNPQYGFGRFINHSKNHANTRCIAVVPGTGYGDLVPATAKNRKNSVVRLIFYAIDNIQAGDQILVNFLHTTNQSHQNDEWMDLY